MSPINQPRHFEIGARVRVNDTYPYRILARGSEGTVKAWPSTYNLRGEWVEVELECYKRPVRWYSGYFDAIENVA